MQKTLDKYFIEKNIAKFYKYGYTYFLDSKELLMVKKELNRNKTKYNIYEPYIDSDYKIIYKDEIPNVSCFKIITDKELTHSSIMGALYNFNISEDYLGDIIIDNGYYFITLEEVSNFILDNFEYIGKTKVKLRLSEIPLYERKYEDLELIVSSGRIDTVISRLIKKNRSDIDDIITRKEIILNNEILTNKSYNLKENDIFSIRRYGKYKYIGIVNKTKKENDVILVKKYI